MSIRRFEIGDAADEMFKIVEDEGRISEFIATENNYFPALAIESRKPL